MRTLLAIAAVAATFTSAAHAEEEPEHVPTLCYEVTRTGTLGPPLFAGPVCVPVVMPPANCQTTTLTTTPLNVVTVYWCLPR